ncbi:PD-(D/E)XK nuclease family protein [Bifidobacterium choloepi]|uniref:AAA family ATPase n=1 Tax=Bifidobacterium choloepi TaxID=2614131 RepID=A0A6I5NGJ9_9BIFI|nr:PD-(D/E)XK nuclease family protein [Bifidobacterium choloepi]NEG70404.1 AAA family ATPase [Bifidobacterium choloepi]
MERTTTERPEAARATEQTTVLVTGAPCSGKTEAAYRLMLGEIGRHGESRVVMCVPDRQTADRLSDRLIRDLHVVSQARPVTTLNALAFRIVTDYGKATGKPLPRLLNGAEQDAMLRRVLATHVAEAERGEAGDCATCRLLADYFASADWSRIVLDGSVSGAAAGSASGAGAAVGAAGMAGTPVATGESSHVRDTASMFVAGISDMFVDQLRDMLARIDETSGGDGLDEDAFLAAVGNQGLRGDRLRIQWRLAFALRREYLAAVRRRYPHEYRLDASQLLAQGAHLVRMLAAGGDGTGKDSAGAAPSGSAAGSAIGGTADGTIASVLPKAVIVDDFQDVTLAGLAFLEALADAGVELALAGNPDESVQTFRGSYPDFLFREARRRLRAEPLRLPYRPLVDGSIGNDSSAETTAETTGNADAAGIVPDNADADRTLLIDDLKEQVRQMEAAEREGSADVLPEEEHEPTMLETVAARVSLSIAAQEPTDVAMPNRPGKMPAFPGSYPIARLADDDPRRRDGTVRAALYRSSREQLDDIVWQCKTLHLDPATATPWNDMAVVMHDNAAIRELGERLRRDGVPVRYSSVTQPLADEPFVRALFALIELAELRNDGLASRLGSPAMKNDSSDEGGARTAGAAVHRGMTMRQLAKYVRTRVQAIAESPLVAAGATRHAAGAPLRPETIDTTMRSLEALASLVAGNEQATEAAGTTAEGALVPKLIGEWDDLKATLAGDEADAGNDGATVTVDESLIDSEAGENDLPFGRDAMLLMLAAGDGAMTADGTADSASAAGSAAGGAADTPESDVLAAIEAVVGSRSAASQADAYAHLWKLVGDVAGELRRLDDPAPQYALFAAWQAAGVAERWQEEALFNTPAGRAANDRLDVAMRLFAYAEGAAGTPDVDTFIEQVRQLNIQADSLAKTAPVDQAVTLTTPAGAAGRHWPVVWLPGVQQGTWPNLATRNTMFGGEDLVDIRLYGTLDSGREVATGLKDLALRKTLADEQKSLLVALTRATAQVRIGAVLDDAAVPSDFLYGYLPEWFDRDRDADPDSRQYTMPGQLPANDSEKTGALDADMRGLVAMARSILATADPESPEAVDAARTLALLVANGVTEANPSTWPFTDNRGTVDEVTPPEPEDGAQAAQVGVPTARWPDPFAAGTIHSRGGMAGESSSHGSDDTAHRPRIVTLSPSQVDSIWNCPVCWMLDKQFSGPQASNVSSDFGTLLHAVAEFGSAQGYDRLEFLERVDADDDVEGVTSETHVERRVDEATDGMFDYYRTLRKDPLEIDDLEERHRMVRRDERARDAIRHVAEYFVRANTASYPLRNTENFSAGVLEEVGDEMPFAARFSLQDIADAYNAVPLVRQPLTAANMRALLGVFVGAQKPGDWPDGMADDLEIRLTGRIDRMERRRDGDGAEHVRLVDYKTGFKPGAAVTFDDLQLVCYQLGLAFPESAHRRGTAALAAMPPLSGAMLFHVMADEFPAPYGRTEKTMAAESYFQEPLFRGGALNVMPMTPRAGVKSIPAEFRSVDVPMPEGLNEQQWAEFMQLFGHNGDSMAAWALAMIARVFYAAAASVSDSVVAEPQAGHLLYCQRKSPLSNVCPACGEKLATVYETIENPHRLGSGQ